MLFAYVLAVVVLTITPGVDNALVLRSAAVGGMRTGWFGAAGICAGCLIWGGAVAVGLGALLAASPLGFAVLKWAGTAYLAYIGLRMLLRPRHSLAGMLETASGNSAPEALRRGLLTNLLNPKIGVFYITFLPQFVPAGVNVAGYTFLLAVLHVAISLLWFAALIAATVPLGRFLARASVVRWLDRITGGVFLGFGVKLALTRQ